MSHHNSTETLKIIKKNKLDLGVILGARILKKEIINAFKIGIINMHPGILPENRGLDNIKWSVVKNLPIGVTSHFIDPRIDMGEKNSLARRLKYIRTTSSSIFVYVIKI